MKHITQLATWTSLGLAYLAIVTPVQAQVVINEVAPYLTTSSEWIELYNTGSTPVDIGSWLLRDQLATPSDLKEFELETILEPHSYLIVETINKLNNTADGVTLLTDTGEVVDQMSFTSSTQNLSWARVPDADSNWVLSTPTKGLTNPNNLPTPTPSPTPSIAPTPSPSATPQSSPTPIPSSSPTPAPTPVPIPEPSQWQPSEIMACPSSGEAEWLELYNPDPVSYSFTNWLVRDSQGSLRSVSFELPAFGFGVASWASGLLNNTGDSLSLLRPDQSLVFTVDLSACQSGHSWVLGSSGWELSSTPTLGTRNQNEPSPTPSPSATPDSTASLPYDNFASSLPLSASLKSRPTPMTKSAATTATKKPAATTKSPANAASPQPEPPESLEITGPTIKTWPFISVIMGGALILGAGIYDLEIAPLVQWLARMG